MASSKTECRIYEYNRVQNGVAAANSPNGKLVEKLTYSLNRVGEAAAKAVADEACPVELKVQVQEASEKMTVEGWETVGTYCQANRSNPVVREAGEWIKLAIAMMWAAKKFETQIQG